MAQISILQSYFDVPPGQGTPFKAECPIHGPFTAWLPFELKGHQVSLYQNAAPCPKCRKPSSMECGYFDFTQEIVRELFSEKISRQMARSFERKAAKVKTKEDAALLASTASPKIEKLVSKGNESAKWQNNLMIIAAVVTILQGLPPAVNNIDKAVEWTTNKLVEKGLLNKNDHHTTKEQDQTEAEKNNNTNQDTDRNRSPSSEQNWSDGTDV